jgi:tetratricopeptide (TPR) repeat protein
MATKLAKLEGAEVHHRVRQAKARIYLGKLDQARKSLKEAIKRDAYHAKAHALLASVLTSQSHFLKAMEEAQVLLTIDPQYPRGSQLFELAAYLQVNFELLCTHGKGPYPQAALQAVLDKFAAEGLDRTDYYPVLKERYGNIESVQGQLRAARPLCRKPKPKPEAPKGAQ